MNSEFIVSLLGADRSGLIKHFMQATHDHNGQWLTSKFSNLEDQFAALIKISVPLENAQALQDWFFSQPGLTVIFNPANETLNHGQNLLKLNIEARDRFGLINQITDELLSLGVIITQMNCNRISVIEIGGSLLSIDLHLALPADMQPQELLSKLESQDDETVISIVE